MALCVYNEQYVLLKTDNNAYELFPNYVPPSPFASKSGGGGHDPQLLWERRPWVL